MVGDFGSFLNECREIAVDEGTLLTAKFDAEELTGIDLPFDPPAHLERAIPKRKAEYTAARLLAWRIQESHGATPSNVGTGPKRAPIWPAGWSGSISHTGPYVAVWMSRSPNALMGLDIETVAKSKSLEAICSMVLQPAELEVLGSDAWVLTAAFSAKECLYKCLFPQVGRFFGFESARVTTFNRHSISLQLTESLDQKLPKDSIFRVAVSREKSFVMTTLFVGELL